MATTEQLTAWLAEAETAYHRLMTGRREVKLSYNGETVDYTQADVSKLAEYIRSLKSQLRDTSPSPGQRRPARARRARF